MCSVDLPLSADMGVPGFKRAPAWHRHRLHLWFIYLRMLTRCIVAVVTVWVVEKVPLLALPAGDGNGRFLGVLWVQEGSCIDTDTGCICGLSV